MPGASEFNRRILYLEQQVGDGDITAGCDVDQPYAQNQHENMSFDHSVGRDHYLGGPLMENAFNILSGIAQSVITEGGSQLRDEMNNVAERMSFWVETNAPRDPDVGDVLAKSGSPWVRDNGIEIYRRPPIAPRRRGPSESGWEERPPKET